MATATKAELRLRGRHWRTRTLATADWEEEDVALDPKETGFVALHLWNVGDVNGPPVPEFFSVDMGKPDTQAESVRIAAEFIRPAIDAARAAGMAIFHVEPRNIALKYDSVQHMLEDNDLNPPRPAPGPPEVNPGWRKERAERTHGHGYMEWDGWQQMRILSSCEAEPGDQVILTSAQFDRICRSRGIKNLIYTGFATNMCILGSEGATRPMLAYGYRIFLIREATLGTEIPETFQDRLITKVALIEFQKHVGDTIGFDQFMAACRAVAAARVDA